MGAPSTDETPIFLVGAFYPTEQAARYARSRLEQTGVPAERIFLVGNPSPKLQGIKPISVPGASSVDDFLASVRTDLLAAGVGAEPGLTNAASVASRSVRVFLATPVLQTLFALRPDFALGLDEESPKVIDVTPDEFSQLVKDTVESDYWAVVLRPENERGAQKAIELLRIVFD